MLVVLLLVRADSYLDGLVLSPLRKATVLATLTDPAEMLLILTWTELPDRVSILYVSSAMNCRVCRENTVRKRAFTPL